MGIQERSIGRALEQIRHQEKGDIPLYGFLDQAWVSFREGITQGGEQMAYETTTKIVEALGRAGIKGEAYRFVARGASVSPEAMTGIRFHVVEDAGRPVESAYPAVRAADLRKMVYASTGLESETEK